MAPKTEKEKPTAKNKGAAVAAPEPAQEENKTTETPEEETKTPDSSEEETAATKDSEKEEPGEDSPDAPADEADPDEDSDADIPDTISEKEAAVPAPVSTESKVLIASNFPHPLTFNVPTGSGVTTEVIIKGNAENLRGQKKGVLPVGAYGLTIIDADAWAWIKENYKTWPPIKNDVVFATNKKQYKDAVAEREGLRNGFEPIDPEKTVVKPYIAKAE